MKWLLSLSMTVLVAAMGVPCLSNAYTVRVVASEDSNHVTAAVAKLNADAEGVAVNFDKNTGKYLLKKDVAQFAACKKKLEQSMKSKKPVTVTLDAAGSNILDVK